MGTSVERATAMTDSSPSSTPTRASTWTFDGNGPAPSRCAAVTERVRETGKPYAVEVQTYRIASHGAADFLERYRTKDEVKQWRQRDPIGLLEQKLTETGADEDQLAAIRAETKQIVDEAVRFAEESPQPALEELYTDVYAE
jgi:pyruvate dehydrogenase E1 component alpha subunit